MKNKKLFSLLIVVLCVFLVGCGTKDEEKEEKKDESDEWVVSMTSNSQMLEDNIVNAFNNANKDNKYKMVALLAKQVVAGTNYMFLCSEGNEYKVVVVYNDLQNNSSITKVSDLDINKLEQSNNDFNAEVLEGGWTVEIPGKPMELSEDVQRLFDSATEKLVGASYYPIVEIAHQKISTNNHLILCYGRLSDQNGSTGIVVMTLIGNDTNGKVLKSISYVDLKEYNS